MTTVAAAQPTLMDNVIKYGIGAMVVVAGGMALMAAKCSYQKTGSVSLSGMLICGGEGVFDVGKDIAEDLAKKTWSKLIKPGWNKALKPGFKAIYDKGLKPIGKGAWNKALKPGYKLLKDGPKKIEKGLGKATQVLNPLSSKGFVAQGGKKGWKSIKKGFKKLF